jgi:uncharacterized membrane protein
MADLESNGLKHAEHVQAAWWKWNLRLVSAGVCIWLVLTMVGAMFAGQAAVSTMHFVMVAQWIPLSYLVLVLAYCVIVNKKMARLADQFGQQAHPAIPDDAVKYLP